MVHDPDGVPAKAVAALGLTQIIGYGTLYYSFSIMVPDMARDVGWSTEGIFGLFSAALLVGGLAAPFAGSAMDRFGASRLMVLGSILSALSLVAMALSSSALSFSASFIALEITASFALYQAAFATLVEIAPRSAARSITYLTLVAGFASTIFWPVTAYLHMHYDWRDILIAFAALNLAVCLPLHGLIARHAAPKARPGTARAEPVAGELGHAERRLGLLLCSIAFALEGFALSAMLVHMVPMLTAIGLAGSAVFVAAIFGPAQVLARFVNMVFGGGLTPIALAVFSALAIALAIGVLLLAGAWLPGAIAFAFLLGLGSGINSIAQGALPLWLFGSEGYGALTGRMAAVRIAASAAAPFVFAALMNRVSLSIALATAAATGVAAASAFLAIRPKSASTA